MIDPISLDRSFQTDAQAEPERPEVGIASDASGRVIDPISLDRSFQTDARAEPERPEVGIASDASGRMAAPSDPRSKMLTRC